MLCWPALRDALIANGVRSRDAAVSADEELLGVLRAAGSTESFWEQLDTFFSVAQRRRLRCVCQTRFSSSTACYAATFLTGQFASVQMLLSRLSAAARHLPI